MHLKRAPVVSMSSLTDRTAMDLVTERAALQRRLDQAIAAARQTQETISEEAHLMSEQVREAVVLPEEDR